MSVPQVFNFQDKYPIRIELIDSKEWFFAKDVCDRLDLSDVSKAMDRLDEDEKLTRKVFVSGQNRIVYLVSESGLYNLVFRSNKPEAKAFRKWVTNIVLPAIRKDDGFKKKEKLNLTDKTKLLKIHLIAWKFLGVSDSSKVTLTKKFFEDNDMGVPTLPDYTSSKGVKRSASQLLKMNNSELSAQKFNKVMLECGYLEKLQRPSRSTKGGIKKYWHLTPRGEEFGENDVNEKAPLETHPQYYEHKFKELLGKVGV